MKLDCKEQKCGAEARQIPKPLCWNCEDFGLKFDNEDNQDNNNNPDNGNNEGNNGSNGGDQDSGQKFQLSGASGDVQTLQSLTFTATLLNGELPKDLSVYQIKASKLVIDNASFKAKNKKTLEVAFTPSTLGETTITLWKDNKLVSQNSIHINVVAIA